jgi:hypothetical protein
MFGLSDIDFLQSNQFQDRHEGNHHYQFDGGVGEKLGENNLIFLR